MRRSVLAMIACLALFAASGCALQVDATEGSELTAVEQEALVWDEAVADEAPVADDAPLVDATPSPIDVASDDKDEVLFAAENDSDPLEHLEGTENEEQDPDPTPWQPTSRNDPSPDPWEHPGDDWTDDQHGATGGLTGDDERTDPDPTPWHHPMAEPMPSPEYLEYLEANQIVAQLAR